jgi:hypothetical protein
VITKYRSVGGVNDFIVYVLEKDLVPTVPCKAAEDFIRATSTPNLTISITCIEGKLVMEIIGSKAKLTGSKAKCPAGYKKKLSAS